MSTSASPQAASSISPGNPVIPGAAPPPLKMNSPNQGLIFDPSFNQPKQTFNRVAILLSYPKSGRTWLRFMLNTYLCRVHGLDTPNVFEGETKLAHELWTQNTHLLSAMLFKRPFWETGPIHVQSTQGFRTVWLTRNLRDTLRSAYFQATQRINVFDGTPSQFLVDPRFGAIKIATFYAQVYGIQKQFPGLRIVRYEDCQHDPRQGLINYLTGLGIDPDPEALMYAVEQGTAENMRALGLTKAYANTPLAPKDPNNPDTFKVRGDRQAIFRDEELAYIDQVARTVFPPSQQPLFSNLIGDSAAYTAPAHESTHQ